ncbi:O-antigen ligase family protein [Priestia aryabhattai]|uniref:O-antigen ligase family protein n=1 Tax=Priestia aryabhattai TaxID=412384 RepID=UPI003569A3E4
MENVKVNASELLFFLVSIGILTLFLPPIFLPISGSSLTVYIGEPFIWMAAVFWIVSILKRKQFVLNQIGKYTLLLVVLGIVSLINVTNIGRYIIGASTYIETALIALMFSDITFKEKFQLKSIKYFVYSACILALFIISKTIIENGGNFIVGHKIILSVGASNYLATILLLPYFVSLTSLFKNKVSLMNLLTLSILGVAIIFTGSRTALGVTVALSFIYLLWEIIFNPKQKVGKKIGSLLITFIGVSLIYLVGNKFIEQMIMEGRFSNLSQQSNALSRFQIFREYYEAFLSHPFVGNGYMNVNGLNDYYLAHNLFLQALGDGGIFFCLVFIAMLFSIYRYLHKTIKKTENLIFKSFVIGYKRGFIAVLLHGLFEPSFGTKLFMVYLFIGLGIIIASSPQKKVNVSNDQQNIETDKTNIAI